MSTAGVFEDVVRAVLDAEEASARKVASAVRSGSQPLKALEYQLPGAAALVRAASAALAGGASRDELVGVLLGAASAARAVRAQQQTSVVWSGPASSSPMGRLTSAGVADVIAEATTSLLLIGYVVHAGAGIRAAVEAAATRGVDVTVLLERPEDNPGFTGTSDPFTGLRVRRLRWPANQRVEAKANLHAKVLVADRRTALVGSANITSWAFDRNLECGILIRGGEQPDRIHRHIDQLVMDRVLEHLP
jgi:cardiolipin synthase A/B